MASTKITERIISTGQDTHHGCVKRRGIGAELAWFRSRIHRQRRRRNLREGDQGVRAYIRGRSQLGFSPNLATINSLFYPLTSVAAGGPRLLFESGAGNLAVLTRNGPLVLGFLGPRGTEGVNGLDFVSPFACLLAIFFPWPLLDSDQ